MVVAEQKSWSLHLVQDRAREAVAASRQRSSRSRLIQDFAQMVAVPYIAEEHELALCPEPCAGAAGGSKGGGRGGPPSSASVEGPHRSLLPQSWSPIMQYLT